jgi:nitrate reductase gamma subunit
MYDFLTGPMLWVSFGVFFFGLLYRIIWYVRGLSWQLDRVAYREHMGLGIRGALRSVFFWLIPFGSVGWRTKPLFTIMFYAFHFGLVLVPLFLEGHLLMLEEGIGISWPSMPMWLADTLTVAALIAAVFIVLRRIALPEVRILTTPYDYFLIAVSVAPLLTGFLAVHEVGDYDFWLLVHIMSAEILLIIIPFTKLNHIVGFFLSRGQLGMDFGIKRGGEKRDFAW